MPFATLALWWIVSSSDTLSPGTYFQHFPTRLTSESIGSRGILVLAPSAVVGPPAGRPAEPVTFNGPWPWFPPSRFCRVDVPDHGTALAPPQASFEAKLLDRPRPHTLEPDKATFRASRGLRKHSP